MVHEDDPDIDLPIDVKNPDGHVLGNSFFIVLNIKIFLIFVCVIYAIIHTNT